MEKNRQAELLVQGTRVIAPIVHAFTGRLPVTAPWRGGVLIRFHFTELTVRRSNASKGPRWRKHVVRRACCRMRTKFPLQNSFGTARVRT